MEYFTVTHSWIGNEGSGCDLKAEVANQVCVKCFGDLRNHNQYMWNVFSGGLNYFWLFDYFGPTPSFVQKKSG